MSFYDRTSPQKELSRILDSVVNAKRIYREQAAEAILIRLELLPRLVSCVFEIETKRAVRAAWVLELVCLYEIRLMRPFVSEFTAKLSLLEDESSIRPVSKICSLLTKSFEEEPWEPFDPEAKWIEDLIGASFEWLSGSHKVAAKVFAMETLYHWGNKFEWIHPELKSIIEREFSKQSSGYQSRARKIMRKISAS
jgi:hypothetical protein